MENNNKNVLSFTGFVCLSLIKTTISSDYSSENVTTELSELINSDNSSFLSLDQNVSIYQQQTTWGMFDKIIILFNLSVFDNFPFSLAIFFFYIE